MWLWSRKGSDVDGSEWWDVIWDLDSIWPIDGVEGDSIEALRVGGTSGEVVLMTVRRKGQGFFGKVIR